MRQTNVGDSPRAQLICSTENLEVIKWSEPTVEMNLAVDEELAQCATSTGRRILRLWWGGNATAVLGCGDNPEKFLDLDGCKRRGVGWVKRITGGGTVIQTPGVFNYSYTAPDNGCWDMSKMFWSGAKLVTKTLAQFGVSAQQRGISNVAIDDLKISGNAQARKRQLTYLDIHKRSNAKWLI